jgi:hypothetical protein
MMAALRRAYAGNPLRSACVRSAVAGCALLVVAAAMAPHASAQGTAALRGTVLSEGRPIEGALVELYSRGVVLRRMATDARGIFQFVGLAPGPYDLLVQHVSYREQRMRDVVVPPDETRTVTISIDPAPVALDTVAVTSTNVRIDRRSTEFSTHYSEQQIRLMPIGHDAKAIIAMTPGARADHVWGGANNQANNYQIDGLAANHPGVGGDLVQLNVNWIDRIEVKGLGAGAEHGNFQGGLINMVTKSGTNERQMYFRSGFETHALNASNIEATEIGSEVQFRRDLEGEVRGPILRDRIYYYLSGQLIRHDQRFLNHLPGVEGRYSPVVEQRMESKVLGKLTLRPFTGSVVDASLIRMDASNNHGGNTGYESADATWAHESATSIYNVQWQHNWSWGLVEAKASRIAMNESRMPHAGPDVPGIQIFNLFPPTQSYQNAALRFRHAPASTSGSLATTFRWTLAGQDQMVKVGAEHSVGTHVDQRLRNAGMTWSPARRPSFDVNVPDTWRISQSYPFIPVTTGGEVDLQAAVENSAVFAQGTFGFGNRLTLTPGVRYGRWAGRLTPGGGIGPEIDAVSDAGFDPRIGAILDVMGDATLTVKGHWGRYHQSMIAQFFDRIEGGNVFTNEETWHYGGPLSGPTVAFSPADRQRMIEDGTLQPWRSLVLNETGPVRDFRQPYVDQWLVGIEKSFGTSVKFEGLFLNRRNRQMVSLVDINAATNYSKFEYVNVRTPDNQNMGFEGGIVQIRTLYVPNHHLIEVLRLVARLECFGSCFPPPGYVPADTINMTWNPVYELMNVPEARREMSQLQLTAHLSRPTWGGSASLVLTTLQGDLDNVSGYEDPSGYGPGPYVRVNESVNAFGNLPNFSPRELKVSVFGSLPWRTHGGAFWTWATGDHFSPHFTFTSRGGYGYVTHYGRRIVTDMLTRDFEGHRVFIGPRGRPQYESRGMLDLRLERGIPFGGRREALVTLELFNVMNMSTVTRVNTSVNRGRNFSWFLGPSAGGLFQTVNPNEYYKAVHERVPPRTLRIGTSVRF